MLYTTYLANAKNIPEGIGKYLIVRILPKKFDKEKNKDIIHKPELSPSKSLLFYYKENSDWGFYVVRFKREMVNRNDLKEALDDLLAELKTGKDICLICYEKDYIHCHRYLIAQWTVEQGIEWKEIKNNS